MDGGSEWTEATDGAVPRTRRNVGQSGGYHNTHAQAKDFASELCWLQVKCLLCAS